MSFTEAKIKAFVGKVFSRILPIPIPKVYKGPNSTSELGNVAKQLKITKILIITDEMLPKLGLLDSSIASLKEKNVDYIVFDKVTPDPSADVSVEGRRVYIENKCDGILAFGGGSSMDCAKLTAVLTTDKSSMAQGTDPDPMKYMGNFSCGLFLNLPPLIAIPTTAGTGSETTIAAVISFPRLQKKFSLVDPRIAPKVAILDPNLTLQLPKGITAATGMDALTHAVESYLSTWRSDFTAKYALSATSKILSAGNLHKAYTEPTNPVARLAMLEAAFDAGVAFTRTSIGYVHAIAHQFGAVFHVPHGVANAMLLHHVLKFYLEPPTTDYIISSLATLAGVSGNKYTNKETKEELARLFVTEVEFLVRELEIPVYVKGMSMSSVKDIATRAINEAHGQSFSFKEQPLQALADTGYPVPKYMTLEQCEKIVGHFIDPTMPSVAKL